MQSLQSNISKILIRAALSAPDKSQQKNRIMKLWECDLITGKDAERLISTHGLMGA